MTTYLDNNATTAIDERVLEVMLPFMRGVHGNPSSVHRPGRLARAAIEQAREQVAAFAGAHPSQVIWTSGGTEANNLALKGCAMAEASANAIAISQIDHPAVLEPARALRRRGTTIHELPVDAQGLLDSTELQAVLPAIGLLSVLWANNETGVIQDLAGIADQAQHHGVLLHSDWVQAAGKLPLNFADSGVHMVSLSAHKLHGPKGVGALVRQKTVDLQPLLDGGGQEKSLRGGTENLASIVGFGQAAELAQAERQQRVNHMQALQMQLEQGLQALPVSIFSQAAPRLCNTTMFGVPGIEGETLLMELDRRGFAVSSGSACHSGTGEPSHVLQALQVPEGEARGAIRVSFGKDNQAAEVAAFLTAMTAVLSRFGLVA